MDLKSTSSLPQYFIVVINFKFLLQHRGFLYIYNIILYNLIMRKYRGFGTCVYCYHVIIIFGYRVSDLIKKIVMLVCDEGVQNLS